MIGLKKKTISAVKWNTITQFSSYFLKFTLGIILARLLTPEEFGVVALVTVITEISYYFIEGGFSASIIQKKDLDNNDFSTIFSFNLLLGIGFFLLFFFSAPFLVTFYEDDRLLLITRVIAFIYVLNSISIVQKAILHRNINFKKLAIITIIINVSSGILGIILAILGFSYWAIVGKMIAKSVLTALLFTVTSDFIPRIKLDAKVLRKHFSFSSFVFLHNLMHNIAARIDALLVGKIFSAADLGLYSKGKSLASMPAGFSSAIINNTFFTVFAKLQDDKQKFLDAYVLSYRMITLISAPVLIFVALNAKSLIIIFLGEQWLKVAPFLMGFSLIGLVHIFKTIRERAIMALGLSKQIALLTALSEGGKITMLVVLGFFSLSSPLFFLYAIAIFIVFEFIYTSIVLGKNLNSSFVFVALANFKELLILFVSSAATVWLCNMFYNINSITHLTILFLSFYYALIFILNFLFNREIVNEGKYFIYGLLNKN